VFCCLCCCRWRCSLVSSRQALLTTESQKGLGLGDARGIWKETG
jgi:hypothetical protein